MQCVHIDFKTLLIFFFGQACAQSDRAHGSDPPEAPLRGRLSLLHLRLAGVLWMTLQFCRQLARIKLRQQLLYCSFLT